MKRLNLYLSSTIKTAEDIIIDQFICEGKENKKIRTEFIKNELLIKQSDVFILYLGSSVKECFKATIPEESKISAELNLAILNNKKILLAYSPAWNKCENKYPLFYNASITKKETGIIEVEGISGTALSASEIINIYSKAVEKCISEKNIEHQFEAHLLLETKTIFNEELLLIN